MLSCKKAIELMSEGMDHKLPFWRRLSLRLHVAMCHHCPRYARQIRSLDLAVRQHYSADPSRTTTEPLARTDLERIKALLREAASKSEPQKDS